MVKFGGLQSEGRELAMKVAELQEKLRVVTEEKQQLQSMLEIIQAQVWNNKCMYMYIYLELASI